MNEFAWAKSFPGAITVSDENGGIVFMNEKSAETFIDDGGSELLGSSVFDCHPEPSRTKLHILYTTQLKNIYTIEKHGVRKLIYQVPWYHEGKFAGYIELALEIPGETPHYLRD